MANETQSPKDSLADNVTPLPRREGLKRGIYLLPNLITTGALFAGFYSVIASMSGAVSYTHLTLPTILRV